MHALNSKRRLYVRLNRTNGILSLHGDRYDACVNGALIEPGYSNVCGLISIDSHKIIFHQRGRSSGYIYPKFRHGIYAVYAAHRHLLTVWYGKRLLIVVA